MIEISTNPILKHTMNGFPPRTRTSKVRIAAHRLQGDNRERSACGPKAAVEARAGTSGPATGVHPCRLKGSLEQGGSGAILQPAL